MVKHIKEKFKSINKKKFLNNSSYVLDIGSNDGTFLNFFFQKKIKNLIFMVSIHQQENLKNTIEKI